MPALPAVSDTESNFDEEESMKVKMGKEVSCLFSSSFYSLEVNFDGFCEFRSLPTHTKPCTKLDLSQRGTTRTKNQSNYEHGPSSAHHHEPKHGIGEDRCRGKD